MTKNRDFGKVHLARADTKNREIHKSFQSFVRAMDKCLESCDTYYCQYTKNRGRCLPWDDYSTNSTEACPIKCTDQLTCTTYAPLGYVLNPPIIGKWSAHNNTICDKKLSVLSVIMIIGFCIFIGAITVWGVLRYASNKWPGRLSCLRFRRFRVKRISKDDRVQLIEQGTIVRGTNDHNDENRDRIEVGEEGEVIEFQ